MSCPKILYRYSKPCQYDTVEHGTLCRVETGTPGKYDIYKQISKDENRPLWELQDADSVGDMQLVVTACGDLTDPY